MKNTRDHFPGFLFLIVNLIFLVSLDFYGKTIYSNDWTFISNFNIAIREILNFPYVSWPYIGGIMLPDATSLGLNIFQLLLYKISLESNFVAQHLMILIIFSISQFGTYKLARYMNIGKMLSIGFSISYSFSPTVYNWTIFGWTNNLLQYAFLPILIWQIIRIYNENFSLKYFIIFLILGQVMFMGNLYLLYFTFLLIMFVIFSIHVYKTRTSLFLMARKIGTLIILLFHPIIISQIINLGRPNIRNSSVGSVSLGQERALKWHTLFTGNGITFNNTFYLVNDFNELWIIRAVVLFALLAISLYLFFWKKNIIIISLFFIIFSTVFPYLSNIINYIVVVTGLPFRDFNRYISGSYIFLLLPAFLGLRFVSTKSKSSAIFILIIIVSPILTFIYPGLNHDRAEVGSGKLNLQAINLELPNTISSLNALYTSSGLKSIWIPNRPHVYSSDYPGYLFPYNAVFNYEPYFLEYAAVDSSINDIKFKTYDGKKIFSSNLATAIKNEMILNRRSFVTFSSKFFNTNDYFAYSAIRNSKDFELFQSEKQYFFNLNEMNEDQRLKLALGTQDLQKLKILSQDSNDYVRKAVAENPSSSPSILISMQNDANGVVKEIINYRIKDFDFEVKEVSELPIAEYETYKLKENNELNYFGYWISQKKRLIIDLSEDTQCYPKLVTETLKSKNYRAVIKINNNCSRRVFFILPFNQTSWQITVKSDTFFKNVPNSFNTILSLKQSLQGTQANSNFSLVEIYGKVK